MEILGIDIGGSGIKGAIVDTDQGKLLTERHRIETPQPATPKAIIKTVQEVIRFFNWKGPVGCGFPAAIVNEVVMTASNIDKSWIGLNAGAEIKKQTGCSAHLINDVDAAGLAEVIHGAGKGSKGSVLMVAAGTGIGTALFYDGRLFPNTELGHLRMKNGEISERYAANSIRKTGNLSWEEWAQRLNTYLNLLDDLFWPELIIFGGGVSKNHQEFFHYLNVRPRIIPAEMKNDAGMIGAAVHARIKEFDE